MKRLLKLAEGIKDKKLREMTVDLLTKPSLTSKTMDYPKANPEKMPASLGFHHAYEGGHVEHTYAVTLMAIRVADSLKDVYGRDVDYDTLIAGALLHDIGKLWTMHKLKSWEPTGLTIDHTMLGTSELYARGFPESVIHVVASHFGPNGPTPPQTLEAAIVHFVDNFDASMNTPNQSDILKMLMG